MAALLLAGACSVASTRGGETTYFDGKLASATSVLAKIKSGAVEAAATADANYLPRELAGMGVASVDTFATMPALVAIKIPSTAQPSALAAGGGGMAPSGVSAGEENLQRVINELLATGLFEFVEPDYVVEVVASPSDLALVDGRLWGLHNFGQQGGRVGADIRARDAWESGAGVGGAVVAVIDTGILATHQDLSRNMWVNPDEIPGNNFDDDGNGYVDDIHGVNAITGGGNSTDDHNHGTHCAGTIGAVADGGGPHVGVAPEVRLMSLKFLAASGSGLISDAIECIDYGISKGADIMNNSWGGGGYSQALEGAIGRAEAEGILFVAAAGNGRSDNDLAPYYPAGYERGNVVSVAALDRNDDLAYFSCYGARTVDIGAPGVDIFSCTAQGTSAYANFSGTSMAAPHVSGVAALLKSRFPQAKAWELKQRLLKGARPVTALAGKTVSGGGLDAAGALDVQGDGVMEVTLSATPAPLRTGRNAVVRADVSDLTPLAGASVTWENPDGTVVFADDGSGVDEAENDGTYTAMVHVPSDAAGGMEIALDIKADGKRDLRAAFSLPVVRPPTNDNFGDATVLDAGWTSSDGTTLNSTGELGEPQHYPGDPPNESVWWEWTPSQSRMVAIDVIGRRFAPAAAAYTGASIGGLVVQARSAAISPERCQLRFAAVGGTTYRIAVDGQSGTAGPFGLTRTNEVPPNDAGANYGVVWADGSNGGAGFGPWKIRVDNAGGEAGAIISDPRGQGISGMSTRAFTLFGSLGYAVATADRTLLRPLEVGQFLSLQWGINWDGNAGETGNKGFNLYVGGAEVVNVNNGGSASITLNGVDVGFGFGGAAMTWTFERTSQTDLRITATARDGGAKFSTVLKLNNSAIGGIRFYADRMDSGSRRWSFYDNLIVGVERARVEAGAANLMGLTGHAGFPGVAQQLSVVGRNLTHSVIVDAGDSFQVSLDGKSFARSLTIAATWAPVGDSESVVYVRTPDNLPVGKISGTLSIFSYGADTATVILDGYVGTGYEAGYEAGVGDGRQQGYQAGRVEGREAGYSEAIAELVRNPAAAAAQGLYTEDSIMDMNLGGAMARMENGRLIMRMQPQVASALADTNGAVVFRDFGSPIEVSVPADGDKKFLRVRALGNL